ncbi:hypothetical protein DsansV1_C29g0211011 [Dioscorea sansibarensis]
MTKLLFDGLRLNNLQMLPCKCDVVTYTCILLKLLLSITICFPVTYTCILLKLLLPLTMWPFSFSFSFADCSLNHYMFIFTFCVITIDE